MKKKGKEKKIVGKPKEKNHWQNILECPQNQLQKKLNRIWPIT